MLVRDYMSKSPVTIREDSDYRSVFELMDNQNLHHIPVVNADDDVVGILAHRDLQRAAGHFHAAPVEVSEVMHTEVFMIEPGASIETAAERMMDHRIGSLPVSEDGRHVVGMITETDLLRALRDVLQARAGQR